MQVFASEFVLLPYEDEINDSGGLRATGTILCSLETHCLRLNNIMAIDAVVADIYGIIVGVL